MKADPILHFTSSLSAITPVHDYSSVIVPRLRILLLTVYFVSISSEELLFKLYLMLPLLHFLESFCTYIE